LLGPGNIFGLEILEDAMVEYVLVLWFSAGSMNAGEFVTEARFRDEMACRYAGWQAMWRDASILRFGCGSGFSHRPLVSGVEACAKGPGPGCD
jgi:hypothetical protein